MIMSRGFLFIIRIIIRVNYKYFYENDLNLTTKFIRSMSISREISVL